MTETRPTQNQMPRPDAPATQTSPARAAIQKVAKGLWLIPLNLKQTGFSSFISAWLFQGDKTFLIDTGPAAAIPQLTGALRELGIKKLDAILLTHIHLDHAGGAGELARHFPDAPMVCHESARAHLASPDALWEGSVSALGPIAQAYGPPTPVPEQRLISAQEFDEKGINVIPTPGHSPHHIAFLAEGCLFAGEAGGVFMDRGHAQWLRPATPHRFFLETTFQSIETLKSVDHERLCYGHFGWTKNGARLLDQHKRQLLFWSDTIDEEMKSGEGDPEILESRCLKALLDGDPCLSAWGDLTPDIQKREAFFIKNSIRGFIGYHKRRKRNARKNREEKTATQKNQAPKTDAKKRADRANIKDMEAVLNKIADRNPLKGDEL